MSIATPDLRRHGPLDLFRGFGLPLRALGLVFSTGKLALLTLAVAAVTGTALVLLIVGLWHGAPALVEWAWTALWGTPTAWYSVGSQYVLKALVFLLLLFAGANTVPVILVAPLMDPISVSTEKLMGHSSSDGGFGRLARETLRAVANALVRMIVLAAGQLVLLPLLLVPGVGGPLWTALSWTWTALWVAASYLDVPMARHLYTFKEEVRVLRRRPLLCLGFGAAIAVMLWVPLLNFFFVPVAVIAGTLLFRGLVAANVVPAPEARAKQGQPAPAP